MSFLQRKSAWVFFRYFFSVNEPYRNHRNKKNKDMKCNNEKDEEKKEPDDHMQKRQKETNKERNGIHSFTH